MKYQIVFTFACFIAICSAAPRPAEGDERSAQTLRLETENNGIDKYSFAYDTSNGISRTEAGELKTIDDTNSAIVVQGSTSWTSPEGKKFELVFTADEFGYHPIIKLVS